MGITQSLNSKANVKKSTNQDLPFAPQQPVISSFYAVSTAGQTVINLSFSVDTVNLTDQFFLFVDGKKLRLGASNDYTFTAIGSNGYSSQVTLNQALTINLNIQAYQLGLKKESEFNMDNRFTQLYEAQNQGFQGFINQTSFINTATATAGTPAAGTFYSSISGRAPMVDLSQNLKANMAIDRIPVQSIYQVQNEFGPSNEPVWGNVNDLFGQVRFVGTWSNVVDNTGEYATSSLTTDFCEITFCGTGLNILYKIDGNNRNWTASVDGAAPVSGTSYPGTAGTGSLNGRNYSPNVVLNVVSGLTFGIHTVKMVFNSAQVAVVYGFEVLNESSLVKVNSGIGYIQSQKYTSSALQSFAYNSMATGTRGGRAVIYQKGDGTLGSAWQAVNGSTGLFGSADHTNEEVVRYYHPREFGAGRSDDFSSLINSASTRSFTLEDGTASLMGLNAFAAVNGSSDGIRTSSTSDYIIFTFVGTGLDLVCTNTGAGTTMDTHDIAIDGTNNVGAITGTAPAGDQQRFKVASGLPYGTHTVRITRTATNTARVYFHKFITYQPKKPSIPSGTIELADYNVMATYAISAGGGINENSTGVLYKTSFRESMYAGTYNVNEVGGAQFPGCFSGGDLRTSVATNFMEYTFFGTGIEWLTGFLNANTFNTTLTIDGLALNTGTNTGSSSALLTAVTGLSLSAAGVLTGTSGGGSQQTGKISISNLPLGKHTLRITQGNSANNYFMGFGVITPIHSVKSNIYSDLQNSLPVGSQGISDNRKITPVKEALPAQKAWAQAVGISSSPTSTATTPVPMPDMSLTIKTGQGSILVDFEGPFQDTTVNGIITVTLVVDGIAVWSTTIDIPVAGAPFPLATSYIVPVSAGTHKVDAYWSTNSGTMTANGAARTLRVQER